MKKKIHRDIINAILQEKYELATKNISAIIDELYINIPDDKRVSCGRVYTIKILSEYLYTCLIKTSDLTYEFASAMFNKYNNFKNKGVLLGMLSFYGLDNYNKVLSYFESAASSSDWNMRELSQMFFRKLIKRHPNKTIKYLLHLTTSEDAKIRRFVGETLRPVQENRWFYENPDYPLFILKNMFKEASPYPRTSIGNNLSDLARQLPDLVYELIKELVDSGDKNAYWIACRNLVKKDPIKVMNILNVDEYKYKKGDIKEMTIREIEAKSILRKYRKIDSWFISRYGMNLYRGCAHNCAYCDGRAEGYYVDGEFGKDVAVKVNAINILRRELNPKRKRSPFKQSFVMAGGGVGDYYSSLNFLFNKIAKKYDMPKRIPPALYKDILNENDLVVVILEHIDYLLKLEGKKSPYGYAAYSTS
ncbi:MAG: hypothetical protein ACXQTP_00720 [Candidatus Methanofastidiosia archaeon]